MYSSKRGGGEGSSSYLLIWDTFHKLKNPMQLIKKINKKKKTIFVYHLKTLEIFWAKSKTLEQYIVCGFIHVLVFTVKTTKHPIDVVDALLYFNFISKKTLIVWNL